MITDEQQSRPEASANHGVANGRRHRDVIEHGDSRWTAARRDSKRSIPRDQTRFEELQIARQNITDNIISGKNNNNDNN